MQEIKKISSFIILRFFAFFLQMLDEWMRRNGLMEPGTIFCFVTCGDWDLKTM